MIRKAEAWWSGNLIHGSGRLTVGSGALDVPYSISLNATLARGADEDARPHTST